MDLYSYDSAGNLLNDGSHSYTYDAENRLIAVDSGTTATYVYDANDRRVHRTGFADDTCDTTGKRDYVYDLAGRVIVENNSNGTGCFAEFYVGDRHFGRFGYSNTYFYHSDWLGTVRLINTYANPTYGTEICTSLPFGDGLSCNSNFGNVWHFTGKERDYESGLDNFAARYDSSNLGRFTSPDPGNIGGELDESANPQSWNSYAYVRNNPLSLVDPDGLDCVYSGDFKNSGTVLIERGDRCSSANGTYVNGTVDEKSLVYDQKTNQLSFNFSNPEDQTGGKGVISLGPPLSEGISDSDRFDALRMGVGLGEQGVNWAMEVTASNAVGALVGGVVGEAIGSALSRVASKAALKAAQQELKSLSPGQYKLLQAWLGRIKAGSPLTPPPPGLTREAMEAYLKVAKAYVEAGSTTGGMATQITRIRTLESALGHQ